MESENLELDVLLFEGNWWVAPIVGAVAGTYLKFLTQLSKSNILPTYEILYKLLLA